MKERAKEIIGEINSLLSGNIDNYIDILLELYNELRGIYCNMGSYKKLIKLNKELISFMLEYTPNEKLEIANKYKSIGVVYSKIEDFDNAIEFTEKSVKIKERFFEDGKHSIIEEYTEMIKEYDNYTSIIFMSEDLEEAIKIQLKALQMREYLDKVGEDIFPHEGYYFIHRLYFLSELYDEAWVYILKALDSYKENDDVDVDLEILEDCYDETLFILDEYLESDKYLDLDLDLNKKLDKYLDLDENLDENFKNLTQ